MNLKEVYEIFYPGKCKENPSVWNVPPKYRSKKDFFEELLPMEIRWINFKIWNDKARRSRFFSNCKGETRYIASLRTFLFEQPWTISRIEGKANELLSGQISEKVMNDLFFLPAIQCSYPVDIHIEIMQHLLLLHHYSPLLP